VRTDKIYLVGFMGAGKTTVARGLGRRLHWRVEDLDSVIEHLEHRVIADIFRQDGEPYFRAVEKRVLHGLLAERHLVIATGGGTFVDPENRAVMLADGTVVWLDLPFDTVVDRVPTDGRRPLATGRDALEALYLARRAAYQHAHLRLDASTGAPEALIEQVLDRLGW
jgi:shikimate kinase